MTYSKLFSLFKKQTGNLLPYQYCDYDYDITDNEDLRYRQVLSVE